MPDSRPTARIRREIHDDLACWRLQSPHGELLVAEQGAQVLRYGRAGQQPMIWLSEEAAFSRGQSVRGGVPVCWPWFGDLARNPATVQALHPAPQEAPFHGLARTLPWQLEEALIEGDQVLVTFHLTAPDEPVAGWPRGLCARLEIRLGEHLELVLETHNRSDRALTFSQALHTYFAVSDIHQVGVPALDGCRYLDTLQDWRECRQQGPVRFSGETDRIYLDIPEHIRIEDRAWQRQLCLQAIGSRSAIVWNPWIEKARRLSQFADDAWQRMLCIETANVLDDVRELAPGATSRLGLRLWSEPLGG